ncbi:aKG-HExxH-type peptide beta-hydroxylase [Nonomuraea maheshkhaliensis]|uniref:aKG-HExxH-type peptide beta-hydroxylase n=1 Tax=Nonomuraea maheshkhaliensis TaxID=419590 RepID=UPI0031F7298B
MSVTSHTAPDLLAVSDSAGHDLLDHYHDRLGAGVMRVLPKLLDRVSERSAASIDLWWEIFHQLPEETRASIVGGPLFSSWWARVRTAVATRRNDELEELMEHFGRFLCVAAIRQNALPGQPVRLPLLGHGELRLPGHPGHFILPGEPTTHVTVTHEGASIRLTAGGTALDVDTDSFLAGHRDVSPAFRPHIVLRQGTEVDATDPWLTRFMRSQNAKSAIPGYPQRDLAPLDPVDTAIRDHLDRAVDLLDDSCASFASEFRRHIALVVPMRSRLVSTFTDTGFFGALFMSEHIAPFSDTLITAEHILHETSHHRLTLLLEQDPIMADAAEGLVDSPWREDPRPMHQILHGTFVFARIAQFHWRLADHDERAAHRYQEVLSDLRKGLDLLLARTTPTPRGELLYSEMCTIAEV